MFSPTIDDFADPRSPIWDDVPDHLRPGLLAYVVSGVEPGSMIRSMLMNDCLGVVSRMDTRTAIGLKPTMTFIATYLPGPAWGDRHAVNRWIVSGGMMGRARRLP